MQPGRRRHHGELLRIKLGQGFWTSRSGLALLGLAFVLFCTGVGIFSYYYITFGRMIDARLSGQIFQNTSRVYAAPERIFTGESMKQEEVQSYLLRAGYSESEIEGSPGQFHASKKSIEVHPSAAVVFQRRKRDPD